MKKRIAVILLLLSLIGLIFCFAFKPTIDHSTGTANQEQGYYIFILSKPTSPYEYLGTIELNNWSTYSGSPKQLLNKAIDKAKDKYPKADALIFSDIEMHKVDCVKFKE